MEKKLDIIGVESLIMDFALKIPRIPETDGIVELEDYLWQSGGNVSSAIVAAARLGARCGMMGAVGSDPFGVFCYEDMIRHGVDVSHLQRQEGKTTTFCICLAEQATQGRSFIAKRGTAGELDPALVDEDYLTTARYLHVGSMPSETTMTALKLARKHTDLLTAIDAGAMNPDTEALLPLIDIFIMSEQYYYTLFNDDQYESNCAKLLEKGPSIVIVTLGKKGCAGADATGTFSLPVFSGYEIVDTTGAGDVFHGGFLYAHSQGWDTKTCARFASAVSYINCTSLGGRVGIPNRQMVDQFLKDGTIDYTEIEERRAFYRTAMFK